MLLGWMLLGSASGSAWGLCGSPVCVLTPPCQQAQPSGTPGAGWLAAAWSRAVFKCIIAVFLCVYLYVWGREGEGRSAGPRYALCAATCSRLGHEQGWCLVFVCVRQKRAAFMPGQ